MSKGCVLLMLAVALILLYLYFGKGREGYANQVVHAGVGGIAGPMGRYMVDGVEEIPERWTY